MHACTVSHPGFSSRAFAMPPILLSERKRDREGVREKERERAQGRRKSRRDGKTFSRCVFVRGCVCHIWVQLPCARHKPPQGGGTQTSPPPKKKSLSPPPLSHLSLLPSQLGGDRQSQGRPTWIPVNGSQAERKGMGGVGKERRDGKARLGERKKKKKYICKVENQL